MANRAKSNGICDRMKRKLLFQITLIPDQRCSKVHLIKIEGVSKSR